jgi:hypothetical protein
MHSLDKNECKIFKPVEITLRRVNIEQLLCTHVCKWKNVTYWSFQESEEGGKGEYWWRGIIKHIWCIVRAFVNATMYHTTTTMKKFSFRVFQPSVVRSEKGLTVADVLGPWDEGLYPSLREVFSYVSAEISVTLCSMITIFFNHQCFHVVVIIINNWLTIERINLDMKILWKAIP